MAIFQSGSLQAFAVALLTMANDFLLAWYIFSNPHVKIAISALEKAGSCSIAQSLTF